MLVEISLRNVSLRHFAECNFGQRDTAQILAGHISRLIPSFTANADGYFERGFVFSTNPEDEARADITLFMGLDEETSQRFAANSRDADENLQTMASTTAISMNLPAETVKFSAPSLTNN